MLSSHGREIGTQDVPSGLGAWGISSWLLPLAPRLELAQRSKKSVQERDCGPLLPGLAWRIPGTEEPGGLPSVGSQRVGHD